MSNLLNNLISSMESKNEQQIIRYLRAILDENIDLKLTDSMVLNKLLNIEEKEIQILTAQLIAEIARNESRKYLTNIETINSVNNMLKDDNQELTFNTVRALGNICYENDEACNMMDKIGLENIISLLQKDCTRADNQLTTKLLGLLVNLFNQQEELCKSALKIGMIYILNQLLLKYSKLFLTSAEEQKTLIMFLLSVISTLSDYFGEQNITFEENLCKAVIDIFKTSNYPEVSVPCLEIFHGQSERDEIKSLLAKEGVCELLFTLIEQHRHKVNDDDSRAVMKMACDLIVIILTGDDCMYLLYHNGEGMLYQNMISWLDTDDDDLKSTGVLAIGNFARKDTHCIQMVKNGISKRLLNILTKYNLSTSIADMKIQHALLSTLKNLVIPKENKRQILQEGLIDIIYPMIKIDQFLVVFKLLGTFRMVIDGQESTALDLIGRKEFIERLVYWCYNSDHLGVRGEVPRLLVWLIKNCHSFKPFNSFISIPGSVKCLVEMISSNHALMQNEAFLALNLLYIGCSNTKPTYTEQFVDLVVEADIGKNLNFILTKYGGKMDQHTVDNLLTLLDHFINSKLVIDHLNQSNIKDPLQKVYNVAHTQDLKQRISSITSHLS